jgi:predicted ATPase
MITYIKINGFKSFQNFEMEFTPLTVIAGANASGKSNLFDALMLLSRLAENDLKTAFGEQRGNPGELFTQYGEDWYSDEMEFMVEMLVNRSIRDKWGGNAVLNHTRIRYILLINKRTNELGFEDLYVKHESLEKISSQNDKWVKKFLHKDARKLAKPLRAGGSREPFIKTELEGNKVAIKIRQDGKQGGKATPAYSISQTVLGGINSVDFPHAFAAKEEMKAWQFLKLNPEDLREPTKQEPGMRDIITPSGKYLASALYRIRQQDEYSLMEISRKLNSFLPDFVEVIVYDDKAARQYIIKLKGEDGKEFTSRVLSEGTLRLLALCILEYDQKYTGLLCFEEPENGIHPFLMKAMMHLLKDLSANFENSELPLRQVIVNTHSPGLVGETIIWGKDINVSIHFSQMRTLITERLNDKIKLSITKILPVIKENEQQTNIEFSIQDRKLTLSTVKRYLQKPEPEGAIFITNLL